jgi:hypothetical protein
MNLDAQQKPLFGGSGSKVIGDGGKGGTIQKTLGVDVSGSGVPASRVAATGPTGPDASAPGTPPGPTDRSDNTMLIALGAVVVAAGVLYWLGETA